MIDYARPPDNMYLPPQLPDATPLEDFQVFKKWPVPHYGDYYSTPTYDPSIEPEIENTSNVYHNLISPSTDYIKEEIPWNFKPVSDWTENDTMYWLIDTVRSIGLSEYDVPVYNFKIPGIALRGLKVEQIVEMLSHNTINPLDSRRNGELVYQKLYQRLNEELEREQNNRYVDNGYRQIELLDLDIEKRRKLYEQVTTQEERDIPRYDSSDDAEDPFHPSDTASPECSYASDYSKSGDEDDKRKQAKRPPGRPKGSGKKTAKRPKSVSVPEFLRNLLLDPDYCPSIIKWEDYSRGMFRFVKPDEVAKLWGKLKQNDNMTFEKFSRAMRYHYRQEVLLSVPTARLVYKFGPKGPDYRTDNPNFAAKHEDVYC